MATDQDRTEDGRPAAAAEGGRECMPCAARGFVISKLGGETKKRQCPWCGGTGRRQEGIDAQASWLERRAKETKDSAAAASAD